MSQDDFARFHHVVQPRQTASSAGSQLIPTILPSRTTSTFGSTLVQSISVATAADSAVTPHAAISTVTKGISLGGPLCTAALPAGGIIQFNDTFTLFLDESVSYVAQCANHSIFNSSSCAGGNSTILDQEPFYASVAPQLYALATATVLSYVLVILIFITPRTFYIGGPGGGAGTAGSSGGFRTFFPGTSGRSSSVIGIGRRPLLQKIAALTVAVSLTIATADTFRVVENQYESGYMQSKVLVNEVVSSLEVRVTRVISDTFLWLAQVQTLIRLFPRHKEKVTIKWLGFGLVLCDTVFSILENFMGSSHDANGGPAPSRSTDAIPALSYLFELSISLIYASCVLYYALSKRRFAFWHAKMRNVCLVALLSVIAVLIPVVFFIMDLAQPNIATWGEYIRWVGAAAASVVVWEWVERIEALERDEKKDGILGREVFDGDEMLDMTPSEDGYDHDRFGRPTVGGQRKTAKFWKNMRDLNIDIQPKISLPKWKRGKRQDSKDKNVTNVDGGQGKTDSDQIKRPPQAITPVSRSDTNSAASTVYAVRYHDPFSPSPAIPEDRAVGERRPSAPIDVPPAISDESTLTNSTSTTIDPSGAPQTESTQGVSTGRQLWHGVANPFKRKRTEPPAEVAAQITESNSRRSPIDGRLNLRNRFSAFTTTQTARIGGRPRKSRTPLAVTFIPSQPRGSRANIEADDVGSGSESDVAVPSGPAENTDVQESEMGSPNLATLPVTVIPPPVRGGRTWSPDDMVHTDQVTPPAQEGPGPGLQIGEQVAEANAGMPDSHPVIHSQRGALTISESPGRSRAAHTPSNGTPNILNRARNNRSATITSINDRLGSASPATMSGGSGPRSATTDSTGPARSSTTESSGRQAPS